VTRFVVIASARSGSNRLVEQLCAQPDIWCHGEVLQRDKMPIKRGSADRLKQKLKNLRERDFDTFLRKIFKLSRGRPHSGFKVLLGQLGDRGSAAVLDEPDIRKIVLSRDNMLACYSSTLAARETGAWNPVQMAKSERPLVRFGPLAFQAFQDKIASAYRVVSDRLEAGGQTVHRVRTDELNDNARIAALLAFLGAETEVVEPEMQSSRGPSDILSRFVNPADAERYLRENDLMHWAHEAPQS